MKVEIELTEKQVQEYASVGPNTFKTPWSALVEACKKALAELEPEEGTIVRDTYDNLWRRNERNRWACFGSGITWTWQELLDAKAPLTRVKMVGA